MTTTNTRVSAGVAVGRGLLTVYGVVVPILLTAMVAPAVLMGIFARQTHPTIGAALTAIMAVLLWCLAWMVWSILVPRWRLWAYNRVDDLDELKRQAVAAGLIWPEGHVFEKTEIVPAALKAELERLERDYRNRRSGVA